MPPRTVDQMSDPELDSYIQWLEMLDEIRLEQAQPGVSVVVPKEKLEDEKEDKKTGFDSMDILYKEPNKLLNEIDLECPIKFSEYDTPAIIKVKWEEIQKWYSEHPEVKEIWKKWQEETFGPIDKSYLTHEFLNKNKKEE